METLNYNLDLYQKEAGPHSLGKSVEWKPVGWCGPRLIRQCQGKSPLAGEIS